MYTKYCSKIVVLSKHDVGINVDARLDRTTAEVSGTVAANAIALNRILSPNALDLWVFGKQSTKSFVSHKSFQELT